MPLRDKFSRKIEILKSKNLVVERELADKNRSRTLQQFRRERQKGTAPDSTVQRIEYLEAQTASLSGELQIWEAIFAAEETKAKTLDLSFKGLKEIPEVSIRRSPDKMGCW
jgi:hypothetical protein